MQSLSAAGDLSVACLPLPSKLAIGSTATVIDQESGESLEIHINSGLAEAMEKLGLARAVGCLQFLQV